MALPNPIQMPLWQVKFYGTYDHHALIQGVKDFLNRRGYHFGEIYKYKKGSGGWKYDGTWECNIEATHFVKKNITIVWVIEDIKDVEIVIDGKKVKTKHGRGVIEVTGKLTFGYKGMWKKMPRLLSFFLTYIYQPTFWGKWVNNHWYEVHALGGLIRKLLKFEVS